MEKEFSKKNFKNINYNYEEKMILNAMNTITPITKRKNTSFKSSQFNPLTKDILKESVNKSSLILNEISSLKSSLKKDEYDGIKEFTKMTKLVKINLNNFINLPKKSSKELYKSQVALSESSQFLKEMFSKIRKSTKMEILGERVSDLSFELDYLLTRLSASLLNISNMEEQINEDELDHYWLRMLRSGFRNLLTDKVGFELSFGNFKVKNQNEFLEKFKEVEEENEVILGNEEKKGSVKVEIGEENVVKFGEKYDPKIGISVRKMLFKQINSLKNLELEDLIENIEEENEEKNPNFGSKTFYNLLKDQQSLRKEDFDFIRFNNFKIKILMKNLIEKKNFHPLENLISCNSSENGFIIAGDMGLLFEFYRGNKVFLNRYKNKNWQYVRRVRENFMIFDLKENTFYKKKIHSEFSPQIWFKINKEYSQSEENLQNKIEFSLEDEIIFLVTDSSNISILDLGDIEEEQESVIEERSIEKGRKVSLKEIYKNPSVIQSMKTLELKRLLFVDNKCNCSLLQYFRNSFKSVLLHRIELFKGEISELRLWKIDLAKNEENFVLNFSKKNKGFSTKYVKIRHGKRLELKEEVNYATFGVEIEEIKNSSSFILEPKIDKLKVKSNRNMIRNVKRGNLGTKSIKNFDKNLENLCHLTVSFREINGYKRHFFNLSTISEENIGFEMECINLLEEDELDDIEKNKVLGFVGYKGQNVFYDNFGNFFNLDLINE